MADDLVPDDIRAFIVRHIDSVAQLEALLLLRAHAAEAWDAPKIAKRLYIEDGEIAVLLGRLCDDGLLVGQNGFYRFGGIEQNSGTRSLVWRKFMLGI